MALPSPPRHPPAAPGGPAPVPRRGAELMHQAREGHTATLLEDGRVLVAGGFSEAEGFLAGAEIYDPRARSWSRAAPLRDARTGHTATLLEDGSVLVAGGAAEGGSLGTAEAYEPCRDRWTRRAPLTVSRTLHTAVRLPGGAVLCAGGAELHAMPPLRLASAEIYDPALDLWSRAPSMLAARATHTATLVGHDAVLVAGGDTGGDPRWSAEVYALGMDGWRSALGAVGVPARHSATRLADGSALLAGGGSRGAVATAWRYLPVRRALVAQPEMPRRRRRHTGTLLEDGRVLVAGGWSAAGQALATAEIFDPRAGCWIPAGITGARAAHTATRLPGGGVLLAGGLTRWGERRCTLASVEIVRAREDLPE